jgi:tetratricopeptide (TPR) repeat protein
MTKETTIAETLKLGIEAHKSRNFEQADKLYTAILRANPKHPDANHNMGVLAVDIEKIQEALPFFKAALETNPTVTQFWLSYINALIRLDLNNEAISALGRARQNNINIPIIEVLENFLHKLNNELDKPASNKHILTQDPKKEQISTVLNLYNQKKLNKASSLAATLLSEYPTSVILYNMQGAINAGLGFLDEAIKSYKIALSINPNFIDAHNNMGLALKETGKTDEAINAYNKALAINPNFAEAHSNLGLALKETGKTDEAINAYNKALAINPNFAEAHSNLGLALKETGKTDEAINAYNKALAINPNFAKAYNNIGLALKEKGKTDEAINAYNKALTINPNFAEVHNNLGNLFREQGKFKEAIEAFTRATLANPYYAEAHRHLSKSKFYKKNDPHLKQVENLYNETDITQEAQCNLSFALAKMYEDIGNLGQAFRYLSVGNAVRKNLLQYSISKDEALFGQLKNTQKYLFSHSLEFRSEISKLVPIFIVGMPRSGTTLVEQIISSHSKVTGAGELNYIPKFGGELATNPEIINRESIVLFRKKYLKTLNQLSLDNHFVTDKLPHNFLFIPLIISAFPEAKIIHVKRDARATCWSNYTHFFTAKTHGYCYDLKDLVDYYCLYTDLMTFWESKYINKIYNLDYDKLTFEQNSEIKKLIRHLDLKWEDSCLYPQNNRRLVRTASQLQVRKKIYKDSSKSWLKYQEFVGNIFEPLVEND